MANQQHHHDNGQNGLNQTQQQRQQVLVVMVPLPAQGHLNQLLQLSRLILSYNIPVHFVGAATHNRQAKLRAHGWDPHVAANIHFHDFEIPSFPCPPPNPSAKNKFPSHLQPAFNATSHLCEPVSVLLRSLSCKARKLVIIHDSLMGSVIQESRLLSNAETYTFHSVSAFTIYAYYRDISGNLREESNEFIPEQLPSLEGCFTNEFSAFISSQYQYQKFNSGSIYNSCRLVEGVYVDLLEKHLTEKTHWALGPFNPITIPERKASKRKHLCLDWLYKQPRNSVIYVSFGTTTALTDEQIKELAVGLKRSSQKFIWVLRDADKGDVFTGEERRAELPRGYERSIGGSGLILRDWAPQLEILAHPSTGGFMSHCGWNSCMESISFGVPMAAWPMHSDQPRNAVLVTTLLRIGLLVKDWDRRDDVVRAETVESVVRRLMASKEGDEVRKRAAELGDTVRRSMADGGVARRQIDSFIEHINR